MQPDQASNQPASIDSADPDDPPVLPLASLDDTDIGWGEQPEPDEDERLRSGRPPHWDTT